MALELDFSYYPVRVPVVAGVNWGDGGEPWGGRIHGAGAASECDADRVEKEGPCGIFVHDVGCGEWRGKRV